MKSSLALCAAALFAIAATGCFMSPAPDPPAASRELAIAAIGETAPPPPGGADKSWLDRVDVDRVLNNGWLLAGAFLLIQWFEIRYYNRTGRRSETIDAAEAAMAPKLGFVQRLLYWLWRKVYFWKHRDQKDPDKEEEEKHK